MRASCFRGSVALYIPAAAMAIKDKQSVLILGTNADCETTVRSAHASAAAVLHLRRPTATKPHQVAICRGANNGKACGTEGLPGAIQHGTIKVPTELNTIFAVVRGLLDPPKVSIAVYGLRGKPEHQEPVVLEVASSSRGQP